MNIFFALTHPSGGVCSITWAGPRCVQELATFLGPQNRTQGRCEGHQHFHPSHQLLFCPAVCQVTRTTHSDQGMKTVCPIM